MPMTMHVLAFQLARYPCAPNKKQPTAHEAATVHHQDGVDKAAQTFKIDIVGSMLGAGLFRTPGSTLPTQYEAILLSDPCRMSTDSCHGV